MTPIAPLFISHGAPNMLLYDSPARRFLAELGATLPRPDAILVMSAHFESDEPVVTADETPTTIHDFGGFEPELYAMRYNAPGAKNLALEAAALARQAGLPLQILRGRGFDHGTWAPLKLLYPRADIPVAQISAQPRKSGAHHAKLGEILAPLTHKGVLIIGSGGLTHNLRALFQPSAKQRSEPLDWVRAFDAWVKEKAERGDLQAIADYRSCAPFASENHPSPEHFLPFPFAFAAAGPGAKGRLLHHSYLNGVLSLDAYSFS